MIPFDELAKAAPKIHDFAVRNGAGFYRPLGHRTLAINEDRGAARVANVDMERLAVTPELEAGDLLLMRGDIVHRTQDTDTERVALSWRVANGDTVVSRTRLASGCWNKAVMMRKHIGPYHRMFRAFEIAGKDAMTLRELYDLEATMPPDPEIGVEAFNDELMAEKRRAGTMRSYYGSLPLTYAIKGAGKAQRVAERGRSAVRRLIPA